MKLEVNNIYDIYCIVLDINESLTDTYSFIGLLDDNNKIVVRVKNDTIIEKGLIYHIVGKCMEYKSKLHLYADTVEKLIDMELSDYEKEDIENKFSTSFLVDHNICVKYIESTIEEIENENIKEITKAIYNDYKDKFIEYPAATKFHHPYKHGLLFHTYNTLRVAKSLASIYPNVSKSLVYSGAILHDIMKTEEINGFEGDYTLSGRLFGHIALIGIEIEKYALKLNLCGNKEIEMLKHIVLTHHDEPEFGSPRRPQIIEALIVHIADVCDAKVEPTVEALEKAKEGEYTESIYVNDKTKYYKHGVK